MREQTDELKVTPRVLVRLTTGPRRELVHFEVRVPGQTVFLACELDAPTAKELASLLSYHATRVSIAANKV